MVEVEVVEAVVEAVVVEVEVVEAAAVVWCHRHSLLH